MDGIARFLRALTAYGQAVQRIPRELAPFVVDKVQGHIKDMDSPPNAPLTLALKGRKGPLKDSGALRARITYRLEPERIVVGTSGIQDRILNDGGTITPKKAKKLAIPANRRIKLAVSTRGVRAYLDGLTAAGWRIVWTPRAVIGFPPAGATPQGVRIRSRARPAPRRGRGKTPRKRQPTGYLLFIRKDKVVIPARKYMRLTRADRRDLRAMVHRILIRELL